MKKRDGKMDDLVLTRTTKEQKQAWKDAAQRSGRKLSRWMREVLDAVAGADEPVDDPPPSVGEDQDTEGSQ